MNLNTVEIKAFVPSKAFATSLRFYEAIGFEKKSEGGGIAYLAFGDCSFLLQDFYEARLANNLMMHLLVEDVDSWHQNLTIKQIAKQFSVQLSEVADQPWGMRDFTLTDPSGVLWRIGQNV